MRTVRLHCSEDAAFKAVIGFRLVLSLFCIVMRPDEARQGKKMQRDSKRPAAIFHLTTKFGIPTPHPHQAMPRACSIFTLKITQSPSTFLFFEHCRKKNLKPICLNCNMVMSSCQADFGENEREQHFHDQTCEGLRSQIRSFLSNGMRPDRFQTLRQKCPA